MSLQQDIMGALKAAMKLKDQGALTALRAVKSAILLAQTESGAQTELTEEQELKILQKHIPNVFATNLINRHIPNDRIYIADSFNGRVQVLQLIKEILE